MPAREAPGTEPWGELVARMTSLHVSRIDEMPRVDLYLDQVLSLVCGELAFMAQPGETLLTGPMVNNYVRQRIVPAPVRRRYTRRHVATLIYVCSLKRVFSIAEVGALYAALQRAGVDDARAYDDLCGAIERAIALRFLPDAPGIAPIDEVALFDADGAPVAPDLAHVMGHAVEAVADKVFVEHALRFLG